MLAGWLAHFVYDLIDAALLHSSCMCRSLMLLPSLARESDELAFKFRVSRAVSVIGMTLDESTVR